MAMNVLCGGDEVKLEADSTRYYHSASSLRELYRALFRYRRRSAVFFFGTLALVTAALMACPRKYTSEARLFVRIGRESVALDPTATTNGGVVGLNLTREAEINSLIELMSSRAIIEQVAEVIGFEKPITSALAREKAITSLLDDVTIWSPRDTNVVRVVAEARSAERAQQVAAALVDVVLKEHLRVNSTPGSHDFFDAQARLLKSKLDDTVEELRSIKSAFSLSSIQGRRDSLQKQVSDVESRILETESALSASNAKMASLRATLERLPAPVVVTIAGQGTSTGNMREKLYELESREKEFRSKYTDEHPAVGAIRKQVVELRAILANERPDRSQAIQAAMLNEQTNHASLQAQSAALYQQIAGLRQELVTLNEQEVQVSQLEREAKVLETNYLRYVESLEQTRIDKELENEAISNINIIQHANLVRKPSSPRMGATLAIALCVATTGAIGLAMLSDRLDRTLRTSEDVERTLGLPLLGMIPGLPGASRRSGDAGPRELKRANIDLSEHSGRA